MSKVSGENARIPEQPTPTTSEPDQSRSKPTDVSALGIVGVLALAALVFGSESRGLTWMYSVWMTNPDNSHGLLVPFFSIALLWQRRTMRPAGDDRISVIAFALGVALILGATAMNCFAIYGRMTTLEAFSVIPYIAGIVLCYGGWKAANWAWPSVLFLIFMIPLPRVIGMQLGGTLQNVATICSTYLMQLLGMPAVAEGNVIFLTNASLGVAEACSGIRMLMSFFALTTALCFMVERAIWEKCLIWLSAPLIAVAANVLRITATGIAYEFGSARLADLIFHDLAGWLMMPIGLLLLWIEMFLLARLFPVVEQGDLSAALRQNRA